ncbi:S-layer protein [Methanospirillum lacunae]|uniref:S-layer protein n=1 Tax=Methanospirillum lacunae TaxID=668570 RepID=A0A2V2N3C9_9EURY|nr:S-layer protein [Methanospirillum lacunae]
MKFELKKNNSKEQNSKQGDLNLNTMSIPHIYQRLLILTVSLAICCIVISPVSAGTKYQTGSPNLSVSISGSNEFTAGNTEPIALKIQNTGLNTMKMVQSGIVDRDDTPNTAKMVTVSLEAGDAPIVIKSDPQMIGDVTASASIPVSFTVLVKDDAKAGTYELPVTLSYTYLAEADQQGTDSVSYRYNKKEINLNIPFTVKPSITLDIADVQTESLNAGGSGFVTLTLKNSGNDSGFNAVAKLLRKDNSPVVPVDSTIYIGKIEPGTESTAKFKVSVSKDAEAQSYPLSVRVDYKNSDGENLSTQVKDFGVQVGSKVSFSVTSAPATINVGQKKVIEVQYKNDGSSPAYSTEARISAVDPFTSNDDLAYLGDLKPGESGVAKFEVSASSDATVKTYGLDSEVRYRDALDNSQISDTIKVPVTVESTQGMGPLPGVIVVLLILGGGYYLYSKRRSGNPV